MWSRTLHGVWSSRNAADIFVIFFLLGAYIRRMRSNLITIDRFSGKLRVQDQVVRQHIHQLAWCCVCARDIR